MSKTINQALKDLYLSLGGDPSALEDNSTVSDYIADLENGLKGLAELPAVEATDINKLVGVVSDGASGAEYGLVNAPTPESDIYIMECTLDALGQLSFNSGEYGRVWDAINKGKTIIAYVQGSSTLFSNYFVKALCDTTGATEAFIGVSFSGVTVKGTDYYVYSGYVTLMSGVESGSVSYATLTTT